MAIESVKSSLTVDEAKFYARAALYAYKTPGELDILERQYAETPEKCVLSKFYAEIDPNLNRPTIVETDELQFHYVEHNNEIIFMLPGTRKHGADVFFDDFNTDFNMDMIVTEHFNDEPLLVHRGFYERFKLLRKEIFKIVDQYGKTKTYCSVGHSLGAAMAILISLELSLKNYPNWTFLLSPPKVGGPRFNALVRENCTDVWRFIRINDFLPKLSPIPPYYHFGGKEITIDRPNYVWPVMATCSIGAAVFYFDSFSARFAFSFVLTLIGAQMTHATESYVNHVDQLTAPLKPIEPTNYPLGGSVHTAAQWVPIMVMVIFAYSRLWTYNLLSLIRRKYQKTVLARLIKRIIRPSGSNS